MIIIWIFYAFLLYIREPVCVSFYGNGGDIKLQRDRKNVRFYPAQVVINAFHGWRLRSSCCDGMWNFQRQTHCIIRNVNPPRG